MKEENKVENEVEKMEKEAVKEVTLVQDTLKEAREVEKEKEEDVEDKVCFAGLCQQQMYLTMVVLQYQLLQVYTKSELIHKFVENTM